LSFLQRFESRLARCAVVAFRRCCADGNLVSGGYEQPGVAVGL
jgi:hypothetical protein